MLMSIRKSICIILTLFLVLGFFATSAGAKPGCKDKKCMQSVRGGGHHPGKAMPLALAAECCFDPHNVPCDFQPSRTITLPRLYISSCRIENHNLATAPVKIIDSFTNDHLSRDYKKFIVVELFQSAPIYLQNQSFIF
jgi:hypothetical protein